MYNALRHWLGLDLISPSHAEKLVSGLGAFCGIFATFWISSHFLGHTSSLLIVASMGAGAVLLFAVPHGQLSQPWSAIGGHLVASAIGVSVSMLVEPPMLAAALAVSLAVVAMHYLHCIHPPGGATALIAVIGGADVHAMGFAFVLLVMLNALSIFAIAVLFNYPFKWRRYPAAWAVKQAPANDVDGPSIEDLERAIQDLNLTVDITEDELLKIYAQAREQHNSARHQS
ncbi:MAG: HPP family protein [Mariprofundaceae bacterium]